MVVSAAGLAVAAAAPGIAVFATAIGLVGISSVVAQVIVPMSSSLAAQAERGRVVGTVMSGLLIGILGARTASGLIASALGWRAVFIAAAALMLVLAATLRRVLPRVPPTTDLGYGGLLHSVLKLIGEEPILRQRMALGALGFGCFSILWTALAFLLSAPPFNYSNAVIGLFGLAGVAGALAASAAGRLADRGLGAQVTTAMLIVLPASWAVLAAGAGSAVVLIIGIAALDLGVQGLHISNQHAIYALRPEARSRLTTAYMVSSFLGATVLSALTTTVYASDGWSGVCVLGAIVSMIALVVWTVTALVMGARPGRAGLADRPGCGGRAGQPGRRGHPLEAARGEAE
jgi:predicted MFS family arabinose efflux permease